MIWPHWLALYAATLAFTILLDSRGFGRPLMLVGFPLFALDCSCNVLADLRIWPPRIGSPLGTLSATAWRVREQRYWGWTHAVIDFLFGAGHCERQAVRELTYGNAWGAWRAGWSGR